MQLPADSPDFRRPLAARPTFDPDALTRALRIAGAVLVVASASTFMLQRWQSGNDLGRYAMLVGQSLLLTAAAYFVGLTVREGRSARTFLALVLATIPVSFAVLGGLVYSQFHLEPLGVLPHYASWIAPDKASAVLAVIATLIVLVPLALVAFVALARRHARTLTLAFVAANLLVLVPIRAPVLAAVLAGTALLALLKLEIAKFSRSTELDTLEGKLARAMPFFAPVIMIGRVFHLYDVSPPFWGCLLLVAGSAIWLSTPRTASSLHRDGGAMFAGGTACLGWWLCWSEVVTRHDPTSSHVLLLGLPCALLLAVASLKADTLREALFAGGTLLGLGSAVTASALHLDSLSALFCILAGVVVAVSGAAVRAQVRTVAGTLVAIFGLGAGVWLAVHADDMLRWVSLSVLGVVFIVGSAYVERHRARIARIWERLSPSAPERREA
ncbi:MAG TPA: hypothetical protein VGK73_06385 [Polyangiaceae bacterium]